MGVVASEGLEHVEVSEGADISDNLLESSNCLFLLPPRPELVDSPLPLADLLVLVGLAPLEVAACVDEEDERLLDEEGFLFGESRLLCCLDEDRVTLPSWLLPRPEAARPLPLRLGILQQEFFLLGGGQEEKLCRGRQHHGCCNRTLNFKAC